MSEHSNPMFTSESKLKQHKGETSQIEPIEIQEFEGGSTEKGESSHLSMSEAWPDERHGTSQDQLTPELDQDLEMNKT